MSAADGGRTSRALDLLNFFLADVRDGLDLGALTAMWRIGAALSNIVAGRIVVAAGYDAAFISLGVLAAAGLVLYAAAMPETAARAAAHGG